MTGARRRAYLFVLAAVIFAALLAAAAFRRAAQPPPNSRPALLLLTGLPLLLGEDFSLDASGSPALTVLQMHYRVVPISVTDPRELAKGKLLLMAQPVAQTAENLVALDNWVRGGGRILLLADPMLEWPSKRPLGDLLRPPAMFMDTGLLSHWGLGLDAPDVRGPAQRQLGGREVVAVSPGRLHGTCVVTADAFVARCRVGKGWATVVADADFLNVEEQGPNLDGLVSELARVGGK